MQDQAIRRVALTLILFLTSIVSALPASAEPHSADYTPPFGEITLTELLRLIQFYNVGGYECSGEGEDGFTAGGTLCVGNYHDGDYSPADGRFSLGEVLRLIQFFNAGAYAVDCSGSEDGFRPLSGALDDCLPEAEEEGEGEGVVEGMFEGEGIVEGIAEGGVEGATEGLLEGEGATDGEGITEGVAEGTAEGSVEGAGEGLVEGAIEGEGASEGVVEGTTEGSIEGVVEGQVEGVVEGVSEGIVEGTSEGAGEGVVEGISEGVIEGLAEGEGEGLAEGIVEGIIEGVVEGEGSVDGEGVADGEGAIEGEGALEGEGATEGITEGEGGLEPVPGPFAVGSTTRTFVDASRSNRSIPTTIYYPATTAGSNQPIAGNDANRFPVVVFGHGFSIGISFYNYIWNGLVPQGYIVVMVDTETSTLPAPSHGNFGQDLAFSVDQMQLQGADSGSIFFNRVGTRSGVAGHSMGGGATMLSVQHSANISTIVPIAAADTNPSAIAAAPGISIPALVIGGEKDCVAPPATNVREMYDGLASECRHYVLIDDASHCQFAVNSTICNLGQIICLGNTYVSAAIQQTATMNLLLAWFDATLKQDSTQGDFSAVLAVEDAADRSTPESDCL